MIIGIDIGNYATKTSERVIFDSKVSLTNILGNNAIEIGGTSYQVGQGNYDTEYRKVSKESYLIFLYTAILQSTNDIDNQIVLGLPIGQYKEDKEVLKGLILSNRHYKGRYSNKNRELFITEVEVYPEGPGAVANDFTGILIDIGGRTTDICYIIGGIKKKIENYKSIPQGTLNLYSSFISSLNSKHGLDLKLNDAERILKNGLKVDGLAVNISSSMDSFKEYIEELIKQLQLDYSIKTNEVALLGGGSELLYNPLKKRIPNSFLVNDPVFANARIFKEVGESIWL